MDVDLVLDSHLSPSELKELALLAEQHGFRGVWCASYLDGRDPFTNLAEAAAATSRIQLGPIALSPWELHPFRMGMALLTLNEIAQGRAHSIIGAGGEVVMALGFPPERRRVLAVRESIDIVMGMLHERPFSYSGELYSIEGYAPRWVTAPPPTVYAAANRPQMLKMSARKSQGIMMSDLSPKLATAAISAVRGHLSDFGRDAEKFRFNNFMAWYVYDDLAEARHEARRWIGFRALFREYMTREFMSEEDFNTLLKFIPDIYAMAAKDEDSVPGLPDRLLDDCVDNLTLTGSVDDMEHVMEHLFEMKAAGITEITLELKKHQVHGIKLIGERVIPALR